MQPSRRYSSRHTTSQSASLHFANEMRGVLCQALCNDYLHIPTKVGQKTNFFLKFKKRGFLNPGKSAKNIFEIYLGWLTVTTAMQPCDKGHKKVKFNKIDIIFDILRLQSSFWYQNAQKYQNYICFLRTFFRKPNSICGFWKKLIFTIFLHICFILLVFSHIFNMSNLFALSEDSLYAFGINLVLSVSHA